MKEVTKEQIEELYLRQNLSIKEIVRIEGMPGKTTLFKLLKKYNIRKPKEQVVRKFKQTCLEKYGVENVMQYQTVKEKVFKTNLERYGSISPMTNQEVREKVFKTNLERYGSISPMSNKEVKAKSLQAYSTGIPQQKCSETKHINGTHNTSKPEEKAYELLLEHFSKDDIIRQYSSSLYPFSCDFYIKSIDTYIEFQGSWVHGRISYDPQNPIHKKIVEKWRSKGTDYFSYAIKIWTEKDPEKRRVAKDNNLNWEEFFNLEDLRQWILDQVI